MRCRDTLEVFWDVKDRDSSHNTCYWSFLYLVLLTHKVTPSDIQHSAAYSDLRVLHYTDKSTRNNSSDIQSIHCINIIDFSRDKPISGSTTFPSDSSPSSSLVETSDSLLEEFSDELALLDPFPPGNKDDNFDLEADLREIKYLLNRDPSTVSSPTTDINIVDPVLERFIDEHALVYSSPSGDDDDDLFDLKSNNDEWKKAFLLTSDSTLPEESSEIATLLSSPFGNEDKVFNPGILILGGTQNFNDESKDKDFKMNISSETLFKDSNFLPLSSDRELLFFLELTVSETLLSFSSENEDKVFNPGILTSKGVHSFTIGLSHRTYETFKIIKVHPNILNEVIKGIHGEDGKLGKNVNHSYPSTWLDIFREMEQLKNHLKMSHENVGYSLHRIPRGDIKQVQFLEFLASMEGVALVDMRDRWVWSLEGWGEFSVSSV
ncbi:hypothetical protein Tco_0487726 [Tanacetum coccineum]